MNNKWELEREKLKKLIEDKISYQEIGRRYECTGANIKKVAKKLGILLESRRRINETETFNKGKRAIKYCINCDKKISSINKYCSTFCQSQYNYNKWIKRWKEGKETGLSGEYSISKKIRRYMFEKYNSKCARCGWGEVNPYTRNVPLETEHIDGDFKNNQEDNLILLCPNCHSLTATYKGANRGNGRKARKKYT